ncbi:hypothetical protein DV515_00007610 [Chloebia gouldiae]|uniref:Endonuclease domain-containing 1 protein n=1 Tax=Chloebia gouldiae TaxID=44316 RepID=A0A3L8SHC1_CHLGU|nr:hypothetical protein DV515_00007610 [Chloebia gouldiae]
MLGLLLLASCLWLGHGEVVKSFEECSEFFYAGTTPNDALNPKNPALICQRFKNTYHFATLYDRDNRIPVYSAYRYEPSNVKKPPEWWLVEPQLIDKNLNLKDMEWDKVLREKYGITLDKIKESQAVPDDYKDLTDLDRGHLCPSGHMNSKESKMATFTLTNIVPQYSSLNNGKWRTYEHQKMMKKTADCKSTYVVTGAVPGSTKVSGGRVNRPSYIWSAACCLGENSQPKDAWGAIAQNDKNRVEVISLKELEKKLTDLYGKTVTLFNNACPREQKSHP